MFRTKLSIAGLAVVLFFAVSLNAGTVGTISACYGCAANYTAHTFAPGFDLSDGAGFAFTNSSGTNITGGVFRIMVGDDNLTADSLNVGTIAAGTTVYVVPGITDDGQAGHSFFTVLGVARDESDSGPSGDNVPFEFTGLWGAIVVDTGIFTPAATAGPSNDAALTHANFLGGPNGNDGCNDCFGPKLIANINTPAVSGVPEPTTIFTLAPGLAAVLYLKRRRRA